MANQISNSVIGVVAEILSNFYTHSDLDRLFRIAGISVDKFDGSKPKKIMHGLDEINRDAGNPLDILGKLLEDYMDAVLPNETQGSVFFDNGAVGRNNQRNQNRDRIQQALKNINFVYQHGGIITPLASAAQPVQTLLAEQIASQGLPAVKQEIDRAIQDLDGDLPSAIHRAGALPEAVYKAYLSKNNQSYSNNIRAADLWRLVKDHLHLNAGNQPNDQMRKIASALNTISQSIMELRNHYGASHGQNDAQYAQSQTITRAQALLAVNAAATLSYYILEG